MKIQIRRKTGSTVLPSTENAGAGEPILSTTTIGTGASATTHDTLYIRNLANTDWLRVAMSSFTPAYQNVNNSTVTPFSQYTLWFGTQSAYDQISPKDNDTFYFITQ